MIRLIIKLALAALIAHAVWRVGSAYASYYKFKDAVNETLLYGQSKDDDQLRARILELGSEYELPITADNFTISRGNSHTIVDGAFVRKIEVLPGYPYPWHFTLHIDTFSMPGLK